MLLTKAECVFRLTYAALSLDVNKQTYVAVDTFFHNFVWKNRIHYIRKSVLMNSYEYGGLNFLKFPTLNNTFKINWIKQFLRNPTSIWNFTPIICSINLEALNLFYFALTVLKKFP